MAVTEENHRGTQELVLIRDKPVKISLGSLVEGIVGRQSGGQELVQNQHSLTDDRQRLVIGLLHQPSVGFSEHPDSDHKCRENEDGQKAKKPD